MQFGPAECELGTERFCCSPVQGTNLALKSLNLLIDLPKRGEGIVDLQQLLAYRPRGFTRRHRSISLFEGTLGRRAKRARALRPIRQGREQLLPVGIEGQPIVAVGLPASPEPQSSSDHTLGLFLLEKLERSTRLGEELL